VRDGESENEVRASRNERKKKFTGQAGRNVVCDRSGNAKFDFKNESRCDIIVFKVRLAGLPKWPSPSL
jgi:hypothetical protein